MNINNAKYFVLILMIIMAVCTFASIYFHMLVTVLSVQVYTYIGSVPPTQTCAHCQIFSADRKILSKARGRESLGEGIPQFDLVQ